MHKKREIPRKKSLSNHSSRRLTNPANVAEVHAVRKQFVLRIHTQAEFHAAGIIQLIGVLEEQMTAFRLHELQRLYFVEFVVVVRRSTNSNQIDTDTRVVQTFRVLLNGNLEFVAHVHA